MQGIPLTNLTNGYQVFINITKYKMFKIRKDCLEIILLAMAIQDLCFKKSLLIYSPFPHQASLK